MPMCKSIPRKKERQLDLHAIWVSLGASDERTRPSFDLIAIAFVAEIAYRGRFQILGKHGDNQMRICTAMALAISVLLTGGATAQNHAQKGAVVGGLSGAAIGAIIGDHNDEAGAGAAIGGAIGAVAGSVLGNSAGPASQHWGDRYHNGVSSPAPRRPITTADVVTMTHSRVSDPVIISAVQSNGIQRPLDVRDIVFLSQQGVSDAVIRAMQHAGQNPVIVAKPRPAPAVVIGHHPVPWPVYHHPHACRPGPPRYRHYHVGRRPPSSGFNISFGSSF